jgi:cell division protein FtsB
MEYALAAIGALTLLAGSGWWAYARSKKRFGQLKAENANLRAERNARIAQDKSFDRNRGADLSSDREFLPDA